MRKRKTDNVDFVIDYRGVNPVLETLENRAFISMRSAAGVAAISGPGLIRFVNGTAVTTNKRPDPVHLAFANVDCGSQKRVELFIRHYGLSGHFMNLNRANNRWFIDLEFVQKWQAKLRKAWADNTEIWFQQRSFNMSIEQSSLRLTVEDVWPLICLRFLIDSAAHKIKVCEFKDCNLLPYFLKARKDQKFCSTSCKGKANMKEWRQDPENRARERDRR